MGENRAIINSLYTYPVKGLAPQMLDQVIVEAGAVFPGDRAYAIENGPSGFDPDNPHYLPKDHFLMLMRNERMAAVKAEFDIDTHDLALSMEGADPIRKSLRTVDGRQAVEHWFDRHFVDDLRGPAKVLNGPGHSFSDVPDRVVSLINLASVRDLKRHIGTPVDPLRFRGNIYVDGLEPWAEFDWVGSSIVAGDVRLETLARIKRCAATNVDPSSAQRDMTIPRTLLQTYGHADCGIYLTVTTGGTLRPGMGLGLDAQGARRGLPF